MIPLEVSSNSSFCFIHFAGFRPVDQCAHKRLAPAKTSKGFTEVNVCYSAEDACKILFRRVLGSVSSSARVTGLGGERFEPMSLRRKL